MPEDTFQDVLKATKRAVAELRAASDRLTKHVTQEVDSAAKDAHGSARRIAERISKDMEKLVKDLEEAYPGL